MIFLNNAARPTGSPVFDLRNAFAETFYGRVHAYQLHAVQHDGDLAISLRIARKIMLAEEDTSDAFM